MLTKLIIRTGFLLLLLSITSSLVLAEPIRKMDLAKERWEQLSPKQRKEIRSKYKSWKKLSPEKRKFIKKNYKNFNKLTKREQVYIINNFEKFKRKYFATEKDM